MAINVVTKFIDTDTVLVRAYVYDLTDALADPTAITVDIYDPDGTLQADGAAMTQESTGIYNYYYHKGDSEDPMAAGKWRGMVKTADGTGDETKYSSASFSFKVE